jgi:hypothetical protein
MDRLFAQRLIKYVKNGGTLIINAKQLKDFAFPEVFLGCKISKERNESRLGYSLLDGSVISEKKTFDYQKLEMGTAQPLVLSADIGKKENVLVASNKYGKGRVLVTAPDYMMLNNTQMLNIFTHLMARARDELLPIEWNGKVEVLLNRNAEGWVVTLINNEGVTKKGGQKQLVDSSKSVEVRLLLKKEAGGLKIKKIAEWVEGGEFEILKTSKGTQVKLVVPSGDVRILEFKIEK